MTPRPSLTRAARKRKPKFRRGQVVMNRLTGAPFHIRSIECDVMFVGDIIYTSGDGETGWDESELRPLTKRERGQ